MVPPGQRPCFPQISNLKQMRRRVQDMQPPPCARMLKSLFIISIDTSIRGLATWMSTAAFSGINAVTDGHRADDQLAAARYALEQLAHTDKVIPLTSDYLKEVFSEVQWKEEKYR